MSADAEDPTDTIIRTLAELVVALLNEHVGEDEMGSGVNRYSRDILKGLGIYAAQHGRGHLQPLLKAIACRVPSAMAAEKEPQNFDPFFNRSEFMVGYSIVHPIKVHI